MPNPSTLVEAVLNHNSGIRLWDWTVAEFFDAFYMATEPEERAAMVADEPPMPISEKSGLPDIAGHVYLAGVVEWLCKQAKIPAPAWVFNEDRYSKQGIYASYDKTVEEREKRKSWTLPELVERGFYINERLHERSFRWITGFDPVQTEIRRQINAEAAKMDPRRYRILMLLHPEDESPVPAEKRAQLMLVLRDSINPPYPRLEQILATHGLEAEKLGLDLSPPKPKKPANFAANNQSGHPDNKIA